MEGATIFEIVIIIVLAVALMIFLIRRNIKDVKNPNPDLTKALEDTEKESKHNKGE